MFDSATKQGNATREDSLGRVALFVSGHGMGAECGLGCISRPLEDAVKGQRAVGAPSALNYWHGRIMAQAQSAGSTQARNRAAKRIHGSQQGKATKTQRLESGKGARGRQAKACKLTLRAFDAS